MKVLFTSALIPNRYEERKNEYIDSFTSLSELIGKENVIIGEFYLDALPEQPHFLSDLTTNLHLTKTHNTSIANKGVLWVRGMQELIKMSNTSDEDYLVHLTGRYKFDSYHFFDEMEKNPGREVYYKQTDGGTQAFTGAFACKGSVMTEFLDSLDLNRMEWSMINIEKAFKEFADTKDYFCLETLDVSARIFGNGSGQLITHKI